MPNFKHKGKGVSRQVGFRPGDAYQRKSVTGDDAVMGAGDPSGKDRDAGSIQSTDASRQAKRKMAQPGYRRLRY